MKDVIVSQMNEIISTSLSGGTFGLRRQAYLLKQGKENQLDATRHSRRATFSFHHGSSALVPFDHPLS